MNKKALSHVLTLGLLVALALPASSAMEIIPPAVGNKWEYSCVKLIRAKVQVDGHTMATMKDASSGSSVYEVLSTEAGTNPPVFNYRETTDMTATSGGSTDSDKTDIKFVNDPAGLKILSTVQEASGDKEPDKQTYDPPLFYYAKGAAPGKAWDVGVMLDRDTKTPMSAKAAGKETITVPAGTFKDCLRVVYSSDDVSGTIEMWDKTFTITSGRTRGIYWIADRVGVVKELEISTSTAETKGPAGKPMTVEAAACTVSELKPGYVVK